MTDEANNPSVPVEIFGQTFKLHGGDPEYILDLARYVDEKMRFIAEKTHTADRERLAVLCCMNIADEYHRLKRELGEEMETSGEEEAAEEDADSYWRPADGPRWQPREAQSPKPLTEEERQRIRERRATHFTRRAYDKRLLAIANGELVLTKKQHQALLALGRSKGWHRRSLSEK